MAKDDNKVAAVEDAPAIEVSLDEFCTRLSETVKTPEIIGGFHYTERAAGNMRGTFEAYKARFDAFLTKPV